jgi:hypothetical protein
MPASASGSEPNYFCSMLQLALAVFPNRTLVLGRSSKLAPISVNPDPATAARNPSAGNPDRARPGWCCPASRHPDIPSPVPAVVSGYPNPTRMQGPSGMLHHNRRRRPYTNNYLRVGRTNTQRKPAYRDQQAFPDRHQDLHPIRNRCSAATA